MTPLRQRMLEDMRLRGFSPETQRSYVHYNAAHRSPVDLGIDSIREYQLHLIEDRKMSPVSVNCFTSAAKFLHHTTLELPQLPDENFIIHRHFELFF